MQNLGEIIKERRLALRLSTRSVAREAGVSFSLVSRIEHNRVRVPSLVILQALSRVLQLDLNRLLVAAGIQPEFQIVADPESTALASQMAADPQLVQIVRAWAQLADDDKERLVRAATSLAALQERVGAANTSPE